jgi:hypothetical protein
LSHSAAVFPSSEIGAALLAELELGPRARIVAASVAEMVPGSAVVVFAIEDAGAPVWVAKAMVGELTVDGSPIALDAGTLGALAEQRTILQFPAEELAREDFAHLDVRQSVTALS